jgi:hypothetical protein
MSDDPPWGKWFAVGDAVPLTDSPDTGTALRATLVAFHNAVTQAEAAPVLVDAVAKIDAVVGDLEVRMLGLEADHAEQRRRELGGRPFGLN